MELTHSQAAALAHIQEYAKSRKDVALASIAHILKMSNVSQETFEQAVAQLKMNSRVALHFHPDRLDPQMKTVAEALLEQSLLNVISVSSVRLKAHRPKDMRMRIDKFENALGCRLPSIEEGIDLFLSRTK